MPVPLTVLIVLVVGGIAGIALLTHVLGLSAPRRFEDAAAARAAWLREFPLSEVREVTLCAEGGAALIETARGPGLVWPMGADSTARYLAGARVGESAGRLVITLPDYTAPRIALRLGAGERAQWRARIGG